LQIYFCAKATYPPPSRINRESPIRVLQSNQLSICFRNEA